MSFFRKIKTVVKWLAFWWCLVLTTAVLTGCATDNSASASYPTYDYWWR